MAAEPNDRIAADVAATTGRVLDLLVDAGVGAWTEVHVFLDGEPIGSFGQAFAPDAEEQLAEVVDLLQEQFLHERVRGGWPICTDHRTHPLGARVDEHGVASWFCPLGRRVARIGHLTADATEAPPPD